MRCLCQLSNHAITTGPNERKIFTNLADKVCLLYDICIVMAAVCKFDVIEIKSLQVVNFNIVYNGYIII